jgi:hypothetical protein
MKATIRLTLAGLVDALRWRAHALAEAGERSYRDAREPAYPSRGRRRPSRPQSRIEEPRDDRPGR